MRYISAAFVLFTKDYHLALSPKIQSDGFALPGGKVEEGEKPMETAIREVMEETGLQITEEDLEQWSREQNDGSRHKDAIYYKYVGPYIPEEDFKGDNLEHYKWRYYRWDELKCIRTFNVHRKALNKFAKDAEIEIKVDKQQKLKDDIKQALDGVSSLKLDDSSR